MGLVEESRVLKDRFGPGEQRWPLLCRPVCWPGQASWLELAPSWRRAGAELALIPAGSRNSDGFSRGKYKISIRNHKKKYIKNIKKKQKKHRKIQLPSLRTPLKFFITGNHKREHKK